MSGDKFEPEKARVRAEIAKLAARPDAKEALTELLARAQILKEATDEQVRPVIDAMAQAGFEAADSRVILDEFPAWCLAEIEQALAEVSK